MTTMRVVGECFFWYRLTRVFPDRFHRAVKRLCVLCCVFGITSGWTKFANNRKRLGKLGFCKLMSPCNSIKAWRFKALTQPAKIADSLSRFARQLLMKGCHTFSARRCHHLIRSILSLLVKVYWSGFVKNISHSKYMLLYYCRCSPLKILRYNLVNFLMYLLLMCCLFCF